MHLPLSPLTVRGCGPLQALTTGGEAMDSCGFGWHRQQLRRARGAHSFAHGGLWGCLLFTLSDGQKFRNSEWFTHIWVMDTLGGTGRAKGSRTVASSRVYGPTGFSEVEAWHGSGVGTESLLRSLNHP